jgi:hypothetical protein
MELVRNTDSSPFPVLPTSESYLKRSPGKLLLMFKVSEWHYAMK